MWVFQNYYVTEGEMARRPVHWQLKAISNSNSLGHRGESQKRILWNCENGWRLQDTEVTCCERAASSPVSSTTSKNRAIGPQWVQGLPTAGPGHRPRSQLGPHGGRLWYLLYGHQGNKKKILNMSHLHQADSQSSRVLCETYIMLWVILDTQFACNMFSVTNTLYHS